MRPQGLHILVAEDNGQCRSQARFQTLSTGEVLVLASIGTMYYADRTMPAHEARKMWSDLTKKGWTRPRHTPVLTVKALRREIYV